MLHAWSGTEMHTEFYWGKLKSRQHKEDIDVDGRMTFKQDLCGSE